MICKTPGYEKASNQQAITTYNPRVRFSQWHWTKRITLYKIDNRYRTVHPVRFEIRRAILLRRTKKQTNKQTNKQTKSHCQVELFHRIMV